MNEKLNHPCCDEYRSVTRRSFVGGTAATLAGLTAYSWLPKMAFAQNGAQRDVIVSVFLRGGADGLSLCVPYFESNYYNVRPTIAVPPPSSGQAERAIDLDGAFGLPQALADLLLPYQNGHLAVAHAVGAPDWSRSHFDAMRWMETGERTGTVASGWLGRHLETVNERKPGSPVRGISLTYGLPRTLNGGPKSLPVPDPDNFDLGGYFSNSSELSLWLGRQYNRVQDMTKQSVRDTRTAIAMLDRINFAGYQPKGGAVYTDDSVGYSFKATAALLKAEVGLEAVHIDVDGWDTHASQGTTDGYMNALMGQLGKNMGAFYKDLSAEPKMDWTMAVLSEFGRNVLENGSSGTDHGAGNCMFVMGGATNGGQVYRDWPGIENNQLLDGYDLRPTWDYRDVLSEIVRKRLGGTDLGYVFPGYSPKFRGIVRV